MDALCFCKHARPALITWAYIKLIFMLLVTVPLYFVLVVTIFYGTQYEMILFWIILITYPTAVGFDITLIIASHLRIVQTLRVCLYYLIAELLITVILVPWIVKIISSDFDIMQLWLFITLLTGLIIVQGVCSILVVNSEIRKLSDENGVAHEEVGYRNLKDVKETS